MRNILYFLIISILISSLISCTGDIQFDIKPNKEYNYTETVKAGGVDEIRVKSRSGYIKVVGGEGEEISVSATIWSPKELTEEEVNKVVSIDRDGGVVTITVLEDDWDIIDLNSVDFMVTVPSSVSLDLLTKSGDVNISGTNGEYTIETANGDITIVDVGGDGEAITSNGDIIAKGKESNLNIKTSNGDIELEGFGDVSADTVQGEIVASDCEKVNLHTSNGSIYLNNVTTFTVLTSNGDIVVDTGETKGKSEVGTNQGDIKLTLHTFKQIDADVSAGGDILLSGIEITSAEKERMEDADSITLKSGGEGVVSLHTTGGDISIVKVNE